MALVSIASVVNCGGRRGAGALGRSRPVVLGGNYGWRCREGAHAFNGTCGPNAGSSIDPIAEYDHQQGVSITGGHVYRGSAIPALAGRYLFGDFGSGRIWHVARDATPTQQFTTGFNSGLSISSFAQDAAGEIYVVNFGGTLHRLRAGAAGGRVIPAQLSATGCVSATNATQPSAGLIPYAPNAPFWSDGAVKSRYLAAGWPAHRDRRRRGFRFSQRLGAGEELPHRHSAGGNTAVHAPRQWRVGRLHL
jgi:hypothetical protein